MKIKIYDSNVILKSNYRQHDCRVINYDSRAIRWSTDNSKTTNYLLKTAIKSLPFWSIYFVMPSWKSLLTRCFIATAKGTEPSHQHLTWYTLTWYTFGDHYLVSENCFWWSLMSHLFISIIFWRIVKMLVVTNTWCLHAVLEISLLPRCWMNTLNIWVYWLNQIHPKFTWERHQFWGIKYPLFCKY